MAVELQRQKRRFEERASVSVPRSVLVKQVVDSLVKLRLAGGLELPPPAPLNMVGPLSGSVVQQTSAGVAREVMQNAIDWNELIRFLQGYQN